jgi:hypothetical protein
LWRAESFVQKHRENNIQGIRLNISETFETQNARGHFVTEGNGVDVVMTASRIYYGREEMY